MSGSLLLRLKHALLPYIAAILALALSVAATAVFVHTPLVKAAAFVFLLLILGSAWWGGYGPGVFVTVITLTVAPYFVVPGFAASKINWTQLLLLVLISILVSRIAAGR